MSFSNPSREQLKELLQQTKTIAVVGLSDNRERVSYMVSEAMKKRAIGSSPLIRMRLKF